MRNECADDVRRDLKVILDADVRLSSMEGRRFTSHNDYHYMSFDLCASNCRHGRLRVYVSSNAPDLDVTSVNLVFVQYIWLCCQAFTR